MAQNQIVCPEINIKLIKSSKFLNSAVPVNGVTVPFIFLLWEPTSGNLVCDVFSVYALLLLVDE